jgi:hypothetical protein
MNENTLVSVHGYAGDAHQIRAFMPAHEAHGCPIVIVSPDDSRIDNLSPHLCRFAGKREYIGVESLKRQVAHMKVLLEYPFEYFLANDADSFVVTPVIPRYVYQEDVLWSNEVSDMCHKRPDSYKLPRLACQPPYFFSRRILERMVAAAETFNFEGHQTPFIDWLMMALPESAGIPHKGFRDGVSCPSTDAHSRNVMLNAVLREGRVFVHSVKSAQVYRMMMWARLQHEKRRR